MGVKEEMIIKVNGCFFFFSMLSKGVEMDVEELKKR